MGMTVIQITEDRLEELNTRLETIEAQRNRALADHAIVAGQLSVARKAMAAKDLEIETLKKTNAELEARVAELSKSKEA
jgi:chromosome segregation ATPase